MHLTARSSRMPTGSTTWCSTSSTCYAVAGYLVALRWMSVGGAKNVKPEKIRNDIIDCTYAAYATYFQGLLSDDAGANEIYPDAKFLIGLFSDRMVLAACSMPKALLPTMR